jgi:hypothetical protein
MVDTPKGKKNIQAFLQDSFLAATAKLVEAVGDLDTVLGFDVSVPVVHNDGLTGRF